MVRQQNQPKLVKKPAPIGPVRMPQIARSNIVRGAVDTSSTIINKRPIVRTGSGNSTNQSKVVSRQTIINRPKSPDISYRHEEEQPKFPGQRKKLFQ